VPSLQIALAGNALPDMMPASDPVVRSLDPGMASCRHRRIPTMKSDTILSLSRRRLLASMPAVAAAAVPAAATALPALAAAVPDPERDRRAAIIAAQLDSLDALPNDQAHKVLTAISEVLKCGIRNHEHDAPLMALKPQFDEVFEDWWKRAEASKLDLAAFEAELERRTGVTLAQSQELERGGPEFEAWRTARMALVDEGWPSSQWPPRSDEEINQAANKMYEMIDKILDHSAITRAGLELQTRAMILHGYDDWDDRTASFFGNMAVFFGWELPPSVMAGLLLRGWHGGDEGDDEESEGKA
jgi:hypothetical protein